MFSSSYPIVGKTNDPVLSYAVEAALQLYMAESREAIQFLSGFDFEDIAKRAIEHMLNVLKTQNFPPKNFQKISEKMVLFPIPAYQIYRQYKRKQLCKRNSKPHARYL